MNKGEGAPVCLHISHMKVHDMISIKLVLDPPTPTLQKN